MPGWAPLFQAKVASFSEDEANLRATLELKRAAVEEGSITRLPLSLAIWVAVPLLHLLKQALAGYSGFWDLAAPQSPRPISDLDALKDEIGLGDAFTDLLIV